MTVYTVTLIDMVGDPVLGYRRTPAIFTHLNGAIDAVINNDNDLCDENLYQYAVIEKSLLDTIRPDLHLDKWQIWFKFNTSLQEFEYCELENIPTQIARLRGFGIG